MSEAETVSKLKLLFSTSFSLGSESGRVFQKPFTVSKIAAESEISKAQTVETVLHYPGSRESPS